MLISIISSAALKQVVQMNEWCDLIEWSTSTPFFANISVCLFARCLDLCLWTRLRPHLGSCTTVQCIAFLCCMNINYIHLLVFVGLDHGNIMTSYIYNNLCIDWAWSWWQDYHVVLLYQGTEGSLVYDLDTELPFPCQLDKYLTHAVRDDAVLKPDFRRSVCHHVNCGGGGGGALFFSPFALASDILFNTPAFCVQIWFDLRCEQVLFVHVLQ